MKWAIRMTGATLAGLAVAMALASCEKTALKTTDAVSGATPAYASGDRGPLPPACAGYEVVGIREGIKNWVIRYDERFLRGGEFYSDRAAESLRAWGVRTVISVAPNDREREFCRRHGLTLVEVPFDKQRGPSRTDVARFLETVRSGNGPFYVHCVGGTHRGGVLGVAYRVHALNWSPERALVEYGRLGGDLKTDHAMLEAVLPAEACAADRAEAAGALRRPDYERFGKDAAASFNKTAKRRALVYTRLAEYLVQRFDLAERPGVGVDLGGGPGDLVLELAARTKQFYWVNADINTWYAEPFARDALEREVTHRTSFAFADAKALPFRDGYADLVVSRGSYQFWGNLEAGLREVHRVLRAGGQAFIGRGFPPTMPEDEARSLRAQRLVGGPQYDPDKDAEEFRAIVGRLNVEDFEVIRHEPHDTSLNYGVWLRFRKGSD